MIADLAAYTVSVFLVMLGTLLGSAAVAHIVGAFLRGTTEAPGSWVVLALAAAMVGAGLLL